MGTDPSFVVPSCLCVLSPYLLSIYSDPRMVNMNGIHVYIDKVKMDQQKASQVYHFLRALHTLVECNVNSKRFQILSLSSIIQPKGCFPVFKKGK